jgi:hypothetical protein
LVTTDCKEWDKQQRPLVVLKLREEESRSSSKPKKGDATAPEKSDADRKKAANERLNRWTQASLTVAAIRQELACRVPDEDRARLLPWLLRMFRDDFAETLHAATVEANVPTDKFGRYVFPNEKSSATRTAGMLWRMMLWPVSDFSEVKSAKNQSGFRQQRILKVGVMPDLDRLAHEVSSEQLFALATRCGVPLSLTGWWESARQPGPQRDLLAVWLDRHTTDQMQDLVKELKVKEPPAGSKHGDLVQHVLRQHVLGTKLAMPRRIK